MPTDPKALLRRALGLPDSADIALTCLAPAQNVGVGRALAEGPARSLDRVYPFLAVGLRGTLSRSQDLPGAFLLDDALQHDVLTIGGAEALDVDAYPRARWLVVPPGGLVLIDRRVVLDEDGGVHAIDSQAEGEAGAGPSFDGLRRAPRPPPEREAVPRSDVLRALAAGPSEHFRPELPALLAPLIEVEAPGAQLMALGFALRLYAPSPARRAADRAALRAGLLPPALQALVDEARRFSSGLLDEAEAARAAEAERLAEQLETVPVEEDEPCPPALALDICHARAAAAALDDALRVAGRGPEPGLRLVDGLGLGRLAWLRAAVGAAEADTAERWSAELAEDPAAWWADALLGG